MSDNIHIDKEVVIDSLIEDISSNRKNVRDMLSNLENEIMSKIDLLIPDSQDFRNRFSFENKTRLMSELLRIKLDLLKQIEYSIKTEIDVRRKSDSKTDDNYTSLEFIKAISKSIEEIEKKNKG